MPLLKTILIVDDSAVSRKALIEMLREDYTVLEAKSGTQALKMLYKHRADITAIMLDLVMPVMDGYDLLTLLQEDTRYNNLPKLVTTGNGGTDNERRALALGAWDFVSKPYDKEIILFRQAA
ncbi:MAG: response regulator [Oscillospiraceae bacterium]